MSKRNRKHNFSLNKSKKLYGNKFQNSANKQEENEMDVDVSVVNKIEKNEPEQPKLLLNVVNNQHFDHVTKESLDILDKMSDVDDANEEIFDLKPQSGVTKRKQSDIDREIVEKFYANPTPDKFSAIWTRFYYGVHSHAYKIYGDWERASDAVQDTFQRAWEKRDSFDPNKGNYSTWLYTICYNICVTNIKKENIDKAIDIDINDVFDSTAYANVTQNSDLSVTDTKYYTLDESGNVIENTYEDIEQQIYDASVLEIQNMEPLFQQIIEMKDMKSMTLREIAERLNIKESKVKNCYYKNKEILAETIRTKYGDLYGVYKEALKDRLDQEDVYNIYKDVEDISIENFEYA